MSIDHFPGYHLAQFNISELKYPIDDVRIKEFVDNLIPINGIAEKSEGFVWRLKDDSDSGGATDIRLYENESIIVNYSVWKSISQFKKFVYESNHVKMIGKQREWMKPLKMKYHLVLFWIKDNEPIPLPAEGKRRLQLLNEIGPSRDAFTLSKLYKPQGYLSKL